jgi:hypothetical protein
VAENGYSVGCDSSDCVHFKQNELLRHDRAGFAILEPKLSFCSYFVLADILDCLSVIVRLVGKNDNRWRCLLLRLPAVSRLFIVVTVGPDGPAEIILDGWGETERSTQGLPISAGIL